MLIDNSTFSSAIRGVVAYAFVFAASAVGLLGQTGETTNAATARAERLPTGATLVLDGRLEEAVWANAPAIGSFTLREPVEGEPAPERTEVRFLYTDESLYIGAFMESADPGSLLRLVARRDRAVPSEQLTVSFDPRQDRTTAYSFAVTPGGVRTDYFHPSDRENARDLSYDPVWEAETSIGPDGWTAEIRIPFSQMRYNAGEVQRWGLNVIREVPARNEQSFWVLVPRDDTGWSSRMGLLTGVRDIGSGRRIEVLPYVATNATRFNEVDPADPFAERVATQMRAGADVKIGVGPSLTLDATINPDFGQVEADPAEVNLSAFETFFSERRPFFLEGGNLFGGRGTFYSRRIGARPPLRADAPYAESVDNTTILGAAKLTGRMPSGLSIGALGALTAEEDAQTFDPDANQFGSQVVAPQSAYGVFSARQELGADRSTLGGTLTVVDRSLDDGGRLAQSLPSRSYSGLADGRWRWRGGRYDASAYIGFSQVQGDPAAILSLQRSSRRYYQRPDADHVEIDPTRTSLTGVTAGVNHSKMAGRWRWDVDYFFESPGLELNDVGRLGATDDHGFLTNLMHRQTVPGDRLHSWYAGLFTLNEWNGGGTRTLSAVSLYGGSTWKNFWRTELNFEYRPKALSDNLTRGGPLMETPAQVGLSVELANNDGARTEWEVNADATSDELDGWLWAARGTLRFRPGTQWEVSLQPGFVRRVRSQQYVTTLSGGPAATFGSRYVFARLDRSEVVARIRASYAVQPDLTLEAYLEPFASTGTYDRIGQLASPGSLDRLEYGTMGTSIAANNSGGFDVSDGSDTFSVPNRDFDIRSFRSNVVLRWEWRAGSTLFLVWQQDRFRSSRPEGSAGLGSLFDAVTVPGDHFLALKVSYWLPF